jgi:N6-adenosine-specific RNA methylase IME4
MVELAQSLGPALTRTEWADRLNRQWDQIRETAVDGFIRLGRDLLQAKADLLANCGHGIWQVMLNEDLNFLPGTARKFMRIASSKNVLNERVLGTLPPDYNTIDGLARLNDATFARLLAEGVINPELKRNEVAKILRLERVAADEQRVLQLRPIAGKFRTIVIDPAWKYDWLSVAGRAKPGYAMQSQDQLFDLDVMQWAEPECHLYCWTTNNFMASACELVKHWGFQHRVILTWVKPPPFGLGSYFRNSTEHVIFATLGDTTTKPAAASLATHFEAPRGEHSEKPELFYHIVRCASYPPYGEANQRQPRSDFSNLFEQAVAA